MLNFVTLFDSNYCSRGLALYYSLIKHCKREFVLYVLGMDDDVTEFLFSLKKEKMIVISQSDIKAMYPVLERLQKERTRAEYSWTLSAFSIQYTIRKYNLDSCTYIDSDVCFYNDPGILIDEVGDNSILITEHNYTPKYDLTEGSGKFCVQFMYFKNDKNGSVALEWWRARNEEWCYNRLEDGKIGDQMYLNDWESRFEGVYNCRNIGCGVAPWNVQKYDISFNNNSYFVTDKISKLCKPLVFFHFHAVKKIEQNRWVASSYWLDKKTKEFIKEYITFLVEIESNLPKKFVSNITVMKKWTIKDELRLLFSFIKTFREYKENSKQKYENLIFISSVKE